MLRLAFSEQDIKELDDQRSHLSIAPKNPGSGSFAK